MNSGAEHAVFTPFDASSEHAGTQIGLAVKKLSRFLTQSKSRLKMNLLVTENVSIAYKKEYIFIISDSLVSLRILVSNNLIYITK